MTDSLLNKACRSLKVRQIRPLTAGGQKQVHLVTTAQEEQRVLKLIDLQSVNDPAALERAQREVELLQSINHPNVVTVKSELTSIGDPIQAVFWLEDYLNGEDLRHCCPLENVEELQRMASDVASGLGALHNAKVVHRDLSPGNVQRLNSGKYVVMDPGFAKHTLRSGLTIGGQPGTFGFLSPEHLNRYSGAPTPASDVFACCALVYFAATGKSPIPFNGDERDYYERLRRANHAPLSNLRTDLPMDFMRVIERGLHAQPARRFRNGTELYQALKEAR